MHLVDPSVQQLAARPDVIGDMLTRVRAEYREMPGLHLTDAQAKRLFGLDGAACGLLLHWLVEEGFLRQTNRHFVKA